MVTLREASASITRNKNLGRTKILPKKKGVAAVNANVFAKIAVIYS